MRRVSFIVGVVALYLLAFAGPASTRDGLIVIHAADSGSHLRLTTSGSQLLVNGYLAAERPSDCRPSRGERATSCGLEGATSIVLEMGSSGDKVEVLDPLPVPLVAYLGSGSDKFIGNSEPDTCYPQGTRRNRCGGGGGDDICISAPVNTDCVGGPGNDYCRMSGGSDGCWGGPGRDECLMGGGQDGCHGEGGDDRLFGGPSSDQLYGGEGFDYCNGGPGVGRSHECETGPGH